MGAFFADFGIFGRLTDSKSSFVSQNEVSLKNPKKPQNLHRNYFDGCFASLANPADCDSLSRIKNRIIRHCEANRRFAEAI
ncbi:hypothetical protein [Helicobacter sp. 23-1045]